MESQKLSLINIFNLQKWWFYSKHNTHFINEGTENKYSKQLLFIKAEKWPKKEPEKIMPILGLCKSISVSL
jgi:hypothetical protein